MLLAKHTSSHKHEDDSANLCNYVIAANMQTLSFETSWFAAKPTMLMIGYDWYAEPNHFLFRIQKTQII